MPTIGRRTISTNEFHYDGQTSTFSADGSDVVWGEPPKTLRLVSHLTGEHLRFKLAQVHYRDAAEQDVEFWEYRNDHAGLTLRLFND